MSRLKLFDDVQFSKDTKPQKIYEPEEDEYIEEEEEPPIEPQPIKQHDGSKVASKYNKKLNKCIRVVEKLEHLEQTRVLKKQSKKAGGAHTVTKVTVPFASPKSANAEQFVPIQQGQKKINPAFKLGLANDASIGSRVAPQATILDAMAFKLLNRI